MTRWPIALVCLVLGGLGGALVSQSGLHGQASAPPAMTKEMTSYRDVVKKVLPAVVSVQAKPKAVAKTARQTPRQRRIPQDALPGLPEEFRKFFEEMDDGFDPSQIIPQQSFGSGFVVDPKGIILTNYHVVEGAERVKIQFKDGREYYSKEIHGDRKNDLAVVRIEPKSPLPYLELGDSDAMEIGDRVLAVGAPFGLTGSVTAGIVSAKGRDGLNQERAVYEDYLQTDAAINPGNSGGPLVNLEGKVVGINTAIRTRTGGFQGVGLAITSNIAKNIVDQLVRDGVVHRGYLGVAIDQLDPEVAAELGAKDQTGVVVGRVSKGAPAAKAGIKAGDIITKVDGKPIKTAKELQYFIGGLPVNKQVDVSIIRDGKPLTIRVTIEEQPESYGVGSIGPDSNAPPKRETEQVIVDKFGFDVTDLSPELAKRYGFEEGTKGALVTDVQPGGVAADSRLRRGMLIIKIDKKPVTSAATARELLEKASAEKPVLVQVQYPETQGGGTAFMVLKPEPGVK